MAARGAEAVGDVAEWLAFGDEDFHAAERYAALGPKPPWRVIAFLAQQSAEKWLKAYLVFHRSEVPKTHNILLLIELCARYSIWPVTLTKAGALNAYAVAARYPGEDEKVGKREAQQAVKIAGVVGKAVRAGLAAEGWKKNAGRR